MRTKKMRLVSALLAVAMMFVMMPVGAFAEENTFPYSYEGQTLNYKITNAGEKTAEVSKNQSVEGSIKIPETVEYEGETYTVAAIGFQAFLGDQKLTHVELPSTLKVIGESAFSGCYKLGDIIIPEGVTTIKAYAFNMVFGATIYEIPASVTTIEGQAFANNFAKKIVFEKGSSITTLPYGLFSGNQYMEEVVLPEKVTEIGSNVFQYCKAMQSISLPSTVKKIGSQAFINCFELDSITIPGQVTKIAADAFQGCSDLKTVYYEGNNENLFDQVTSINKTKTTIKYSRHVSFVMNGHGTAPADQTVYTGDPIKKIAEPTAKGYTFAGWYTDEDLTQKFDVENDTIYGNTILYAKWEKIPDHQLAVTGGTFTVKDETVETKTEGDKLIANVTEGTEVTVAFNKAAYADSNLVFGGWKIDGLTDAENYANKEEFTFNMPEKGVTIEALTKTADTDDDSWDAGTIVTTAVLGTGTAILAYHIGTELYAEQVLGKGVSVPKTRADVALKAWELAGKPAVELNGEPLSETAQAEQWAIESGLMQNDADGSFNGAKKMNKLKALRTLDSAKKMGAQ